jgi:arsenate reductase-like glutaredoxin family protein
LARAASKVIVARGKKRLELDMKRDPPTDEQLLEVMLGRSGTLRAPTLRRGTTLLVGYNDDIYRDTLG